MENKLNKTTSWRLKKTIKRQVADFLEAGYHEITEKDMWEYLLNYRWKRKRPESIILMKEDILKISANDYFDYQQLKAMTKINFDDLDQLLWKLLVIAMIPLSFLRETLKEDNGIFLFKNKSEKYHKKYLQVQKNVVYYVCE